MTDDGFGELAIAAAQLELARVSIERALVAGVAETEADQIAWRLALEALRTLRQFAIDSAKAGLAEDES